MEKTKNNSKEETLENLKIRNLSQEIIIDTISMTISDTICNQYNQRTQTILQRTLEIAESTISILIEQNKVQQELIRLMMEKKHEC